MVNKLASIITMTILISLILSFPSYRTLKSGLLFFGSSQHIRPQNAFADDTGGGNTEGPTDTGGGNTEGPADTGGGNTEGPTATGGGNTEGPTDTGGGNTEGPTDTGG